MIIFSKKIIVSTLFWLPSFAIADSFDDGLCIGAISMALKLGNTPSDFSTTALQKAKNIAEQYKSIDDRWSSVANGCFVPGVPMQKIIDCMSSKIHDKKSFNYFKGIALARNKISSKSVGVAQFEANNFCSSLVK